MARMIGTRPSLVHWSAPASKPTDIEALFTEHSDWHTHYGSGKAALRDALHLALECEGNTTGGNVLLPSYLPDAVLEPVRDCGLEVRQYAITETLEPDLTDLETRLDSETVALVSVNYFGFPQRAFEDLECLADRYDCVHIEDNAHGGLSFVDGQLLGTRGAIGFSSLWKLLPIPDGAVLFLNEPRLVDAYRPSSLAGTNGHLQTADVQFVCRSLLADVLESNQTLKHSIHSLVTENGLTAATSPPEQRYEAAKTRMSWLSAYVVGEADPVTITDKRRENYRAWVSVFENCPTTTPLFDSLPRGVCPQVCPVRTTDPDRLQRALERYGVGGSHTWPRLPDTVDGNTAYETANRLSRDVIALPVHQHIAAETIVDIGLDLAPTLERLG